MGKFFISLCLSFLLCKTEIITVLPHKVAVKKLS